MRSSLVLVVGFLLGATSISASNGVPGCPHVSLSSGSPFARRESLKSSTLQEALDGSALCSSVYVCIHPSGPASQLTGAAPKFHGRLFSVPIQPEQQLQ